MSDESRGNSAGERKVLSNLVHLISQPVTALQCSLEFALRTVDDSSQCRTWIEAALENSERLRCRLSLAREVGQAADAGERAQAVELRSVLEEALSELEPLFFEAGAMPRLDCDEIEVSGERIRLLRAFLYVLQHLQAADESAGDGPQIYVERQAELVEVRFLRFALRGGSPSDQVASQLQIAKETFESAGGGLVFFCFAGNDALLRVFLRRPQAQLDLYAESGKMQTATTAIGTTAVFPQVS